MRKIVLETVAPVQKVLSASVKSVSDAWLRYVLLVGIEEENRNLKKKINEFKAALDFISGRLSGSAKVEKTSSHLRDDYNYHFISARVIGREQAALSRTILINKGSARWS